MSNALAIAAVTTTLRSLLDRALDSDVTTKPPDEARKATTDQVNIFLYHVAPNAALRNTPLPSRAKPGETGQPPLALILYYLITAYGQNNDSTLSDLLLGQAMSVLHDHPLLDADEIRNATLSDLPDSDLHTQVERVRITLQPLSQEEMSKLWLTFQTQFRISAAYQVSVVLIESTRPTKTPLPVLGRGSQADTGVASQPDLVPPFPAITSIELPNQQFSAHLLDLLTIRGYNLDGTNVRVLLSHANPLLKIEQAVTTLITQTATEISFRLPNEPSNYPAGFYFLTVELTRPGETFKRLTNSLAFSIAPEITTAFPITVTRDLDGSVTVKLDGTPDVLPEQRAALLLGDREILSQPHTLPTTTLIFEFSNSTPAAAPDPVEYLARLRVDGVDSLLIDRTGAVPVFRNQKVRIE